MVHLKAVVYIRNKYLDNRAGNDSSDNRAGDESSDDRAGNDSSHTLHRGGRVGAGPGKEEE